MCHALSLYCRGSSFMHERSKTFFIYWKNSPRQGFIYVCQNSAIVGPVSYHNYEGLSVNLQEQERLVKDLGPKNKVSEFSMNFPVIFVQVMILRNHGLLTCGTTIAEAFF